MVFSIIIPVYNSQNYIRKCISSVLNQTFKDWEIILVDDGSTDGSAEICDYFSKTDDRISVYHRKNSGVSSARNFGISCANGDRVMFLDSDDELAPETLKILFEEINKYDYEVVCWALKTSTNPPQFFPLNKSKTYAEDGKNKLLDDIRCRAFTGVSRSGEKDYSMHFIVTKLIKRELLMTNNIRFNESLKYHEDTIFCFEVLQKAKSIAAINKYLYIRNEHDESASVSFYPQIDDNNRRCIEIVQDFVQRYHYEDALYSCAIDKFKIAWFMQVLQLNVLHNKNKLVTINKIREIRNILKSEKYSIDGSLRRKDLKMKQRILAFLINSKMSVTLYIAFKVIFNVL